MACIKEIVVHQKVVVWSKDLIQISFLTGYIRQLLSLWYIRLVMCIYKGKRALHKHYIKMDN